MNPAIRKILYKEDKSKSDYLLLIGYFSVKQNNPQDFEILTKLGENYKEKFGKSMYELSIFNK